MLTHDLKHQITYQWLKITISQFIKITTTYLIKNCVKYLCLLNKLLDLILSTHQRNKNLQKLTSKIIINTYVQIRDNKQIFHAFFLNIWNYSPEVINIQRQKVELNNILPRANNFDIKKGLEYLFYYMPPTSNKIYEDKDKSKHKSFFVKTELRHIKVQLLENHFILFLLIFFSEIISHEKINRTRIFLTWNWQLIRDWREIKQENMIHN